ncbi:OsmC family protein [Microbacterium sp. NC79]|uniref:OsmC family protein n=1 Tax=Microbacterium sp. NC79 TaxID=2851009 RepID=UPI001C2CBCAB|nr:OsmC family protein [Microbacterium sp. NC79]MBV0894631.1 OsmC family protein [Microbacterium sp. NC79]
MAMRYATEARNDGDTSRILGGMEVAISSPLASDFDAATTNPEQLLALAWATCLNSTAQVIVERATRTAVRVTAELHDLLPDVGYVFEVDAYLSVEGADVAETERVLAAAHARCPVSKLLRSADTVRVHAEPYAG